MLERFYLFIRELIMAVFKDDNNACTGDCTPGRSCECCESGLTEDDLRR